MSNLEKYLQSIKKEEQVYNEEPTDRSDIVQFLQAQIEGYGGPGPKITEYIDFVYTLLGVVADDLIELQNGESTEPTEKEIAKIKKILNQKLSDFSFSY